jgi:hypothetical protein
LWYSIDDAINGISEVLFGGDKQTGCHQDDEGDFVVKPKNGVVDPDRVQLENFLER